MSGPMRICYIVHSQSHFAAPYIDHFARSGHEVHLISFTHYVHNMMKQSAVNDMRRR